MDKTDNRLFGDDCIMSTIRTEIAAYQTKDRVHNLFVAGTLLIIALVGVAIFMKVGGFV